MGLIKRLRFRYHVVKETVSSEPASEFATGWAKLPTELKLCILSFVIDPSLQGERICFSTSPFYVQKLIPCYHMAPEIGALATEAFYRNSIFLLNGATLVPRTPADVNRNLRYPNTSVGRMIRRVELYLTVDRRGWNFLERLAKGDLGLESLGHLDVQLNWRSSAPFGHGRRFFCFDEVWSAWIQFLQCVVGKGVDFHFDGAVNFYSKLVWYEPGYYAPASNVDESTMEQIEETLRDKIRFLIAT